MGQLRRRVKGALPEAGDERASHGSRSHHRASAGDAGAGRPIVVNVVEIILGLSSVR
jgi:hypothetical protein